MAVNGLDDLITKLTKLSNVDDELLDICEREVKMIENEAKTLCPVDTGNLRNSISSQVEKTADGVLGVVFTNSEYAQYIEFGTGLVGQNNPCESAQELGITYKQEGWVYTPDGGSSFYYTEGQPPKPFMYPALKNNEDKVVQNIAKEIENILKK